MRKASEEACSSTGSTLGPAIAFYFGKDGEALVILVGGGTKKGQGDDIPRAHERWADYKQRKGKG